VNAVHIAGVGMHPFGRHADVTATDMGARAVRAALLEAGVGRGGFGAAFCGTAYGGIATGHRVLSALGLTGGPIVDIEAGCASGAAALSLAAGAIAAGQYETVLVFGVEKMPAGFIRSSFFAPWQEAAGLTPAPAYFALRAQQLMAGSGLTERDLADVVVKNRRHGAANPDAMFRSAVTAEEVLASRVVCAPLRLWMLCSPNEGAAAVVLRAGDGDVRLRAAALRSHLPGYVLNEGTPMCGLIGADPPTPSRMAADAAYAEAGVGPEDLDVVELQDTDAGREILSAEELGLCPRGGGGRWVRDGGGTMASALPVNPSGGLLSKGEPLGASALGQVVELVRQLRGAAGPRQVHDAAVALGHTVGRGANACVVVLTR